MKTILVTGGAGFIGSNLCKRLLQQNNKVICVDNLTTGKIDNIQDFLGWENFVFFEKDITELINLNERFDEIYNLACPASPSAYQKMPVETIMTNVVGTLNMLDLAKETGARILQASTSEVYGDPLEHPQSESYFGNVNPIGVRACYDEGKRCAEALCFDYMRQFGVKIKLVRIFNTYGPNMDANDGRLIPNLITQALKTKDLTIYGTGQQTRCFYYVEDLIEGLIGMMNSPEDLMGPINLGSTVEYTVLEIAEEIIKLTASKSGIEFFPLPMDDPKIRRPDTELAETMLGWQAKVDLSEGLKKTINYFKRI